MVETEPQTSMVPIGSQGFKSTNIVDFKTSNFEVVEYMRLGNTTHCEGQSGSRQEALCCLPTASFVASKPT